MKIAFYGRFSSDSQRETSIEDQFRLIERWAQRQGHKIVAKFSDLAISGASLKLLPGLQSALKAATSEPAPFDAIVVDQLSRLSRDVGDTDAIIKRLRFRGVGVIAVSDNINTSDETTKINVTVKSLVNELYLDDLRKTTKRGLDGQFLKGYSTGGRTYGYRSQPVYHPSGRTDPHGNPIPVGYKIEVDEFEAQVVRSIFEWFKAGLGEKTLAKRLNAETTGRSWRANTIFGMLQNEKYIGRFTFNRRQWIKNPETGRRAYRWRPPEQWEIRRSEELRIIDNETWEGVRRRLRTRRHLFSSVRGGASHLLSGLLVCELCGGAFTIVGKDYYGCRNHTTVGICSNPVRIRRGTIEHLVLGAVSRDLAARVEELRQAAAQVFRTQRPSSSLTDKRLRELKRRAQAILNAIKEAGLLGLAREQAIAAHAQTQDEIRTLQQMNSSTSSSKRRSEVRYDRSVVDDFLQNLDDALSSNVELGREFLHETFARIRIRPLTKRQVLCPLCGKPMAKITPQHIGTHGLELEQGYRRFPQLGLTHSAQLVAEPLPGGFINAVQPFDLLQSLSVSK